MTRCLLFDAMAEGHGLKNWCALLNSQSFARFLERGQTEVHALIPASLHDKIHGEMGGNKVWHQVQWFADERLDKSDTPADRKWAHTRLRQQIKQHSYQAAALFYGDIYLPFFPALRFATPQLKISCLWFRPALHFKEYNYKLGKKNSFETSSQTPFFKQRILNLFLRLGIVNQVAFQDEAGVAWSRSRGLNIIHFPAPPSFDEFVELPARKDGKDKLKFLLFGSLSERKGVFSVLDGFSALEEKAANKCSLDLIGSCHPAQKEAIHRKVAELEGRGIMVTLDDRFVAQSEVRDIYARADVMLLLYEGALVQPSGVLVQSAAFGRPVLATDAGWVGYTVNKHRLGLAVDTSIPSALADAITRMIEGERNFNPDQALTFARTHAPEKYGEAIVQLLEP